MTQPRVAQQELDRDGRVGLALWNKIVPSPVTSRDRREVEGERTVAIPIDHTTRPHGETEREALRG